MTTGTFLRYLGRLNPKLRVCSFENSANLAGLYYINAKDEWVDICGVDKEYVPEYSEWDKAGHLTVSGWRRVAFILLRLHLTTREKIVRNWPGFFLHWSQGRVDKDRLVQIENPTKKKAAEVLTDLKAVDDEAVLDLAADLHKNDPDHLKEEREHDKWFLETWKSKGGGLRDKPAY